MTSLTSTPPGIYRGAVSGVESGRCTARIEVRRAPGGCLTVDYEASSDEHGLQHVEHVLVAPDALYVAFGEAEGVRTFRAGAAGIFISEVGPPMQIAASFEDGVLTWAWHWGTGAHDLIERSRATCRLATC